MTKVFCPACGEPLVRKDFSLAWAEAEHWWCESDSDQRECPDCDGSKRVFMLQGEFDCETCDGEGVVKQVPCRLSGTFFKVHHPYRGVDSKPELDFWSVTWIK
jgi:hypothetical protein